MTQNFKKIWWKFLGVSICKIDIKKRRTACFWAIVQRKGQKIDENSVKNKGKSVKKSIKIKGRNNKK